MAFELVQRLIVVTFLGEDVLSKSSTLALLAH
jgi:hypothetical protein